jgi:hypothetical protein
MPLWGQQREILADRLIEALTSLAIAVKGLGTDTPTGQRLADHIIECERRYQMFDKQSDERHRENAQRLSHQDVVLAKQNKLLNGLAFMAVSILLSTISILITVIVQGHHS